MRAALSGTGRLTEAKYSRPAKSTAHGGWGHSRMTHSYTHRETGTHMHKVYTVHTQNFLKNTRQRFAAVKTCKKILNGNVKVNKYLVVTLTGFCQLLFFLHR